MHARRPLTSIFAALFLLLLAAGQAASQSRSAGAPPRGGAGGAEPSTTVEQFLRLAGRKQYLDMGWLFGTREGPVIQRDGRPDVERRMYALASVLENERFVIRDETPIPGSVGEAVRLTVQIRNRGRTLDVPFVTVRGPGGRWFVEQIDVQAVTAPRQ